MALARENEIDIIFPLIISSASVLVTVPVERFGCGPTRQDPQQKR
jgi:hypothetical protein